MPIDEEGVDGDEPVVVAFAALMLVDFCSSLGLSPPELLQAAGLEPQWLMEHSDGLIPYEAVIRLWADVIERVGDRPVGLMFAQHLASSQATSKKALGVIGYAIHNSRDLRQVYTLVIRYSNIVVPLCTLSMEDHGDQVHVVFGAEPRLDEMIEPLEYLVAVLANARFMMAERTPSMRGVHFRHPRRHPMEVYTQTFDAPVHFESSWCGLCFDAADLALPVAGADPQLGAYLREQADALAAEHVASAVPPPLDIQVREAVDQGLMSGTIDQASVAKRLGMSPRTLQRGLGALGTSFSAQVENVRRSRALQLMRRPELSVAEVAFMLGYGDPRSFYRNFRRWTGHNPTAYRRMQAATA